MSQSQDTDARTATPEASREIDVRIALEVMGWEITHRGRRVVTGDGKEVGGMTGIADARGWIASVCPHYSTEIAAAWEVVEAMVARGLYPDIARIRDSPSDFWRCDVFASDGCITYEDAATAPLAICLAALASLPEEPK